MYIYHLCIILIIIIFIVLYLLFLCVPLFNTETPLQRQKAHTCKVHSSIHMSIHMDEEQLFSNKSSFPILQI